MKLERKFSEDGMIKALQEIERSHACRDVDRISDSVSSMKDLDPDQIHFVDFSEHVCRGNVANSSSVGNCWMACGLIDD